MDFLTAIREYAKTTNNILARIKQGDVDALDDAFLYDIPDEMIADALHESKLLDRMYQVDMEIARLMTLIDEGK